MEGNFIYFSLARLLTHSLTALSGGKTFLVFPPFSIAPYRWALIWAAEIRSSCKTRAIGYELLRRISEVTSIYLDNGFWICFGIVCKPSWLLICLDAKVMIWSTTWLSFATIYKWRTYYLWPVFCWSRFKCIRWQTLKRFRGIGKQT